MDAVTVRLAAHLSFDGTCEEAFRFYQRVLGGTITTMLKYADSPLAGQTPPHLRNRIVHATLKLETTELFGADLMPDDYRPATGFSIAVNLLDLQQARKIFNELSEGGEIQMKFGTTFWSAGFGVLVDRFGTPWEINCELEPHEE